MLERADPQITLRVLGDRLLMLAADPALAAHGFTFTLQAQHERRELVAVCRSLLELAPLELDCMNTLWPMGEGTVREIRDRMAGRRSRAYTSIMTIMDRLARKGVVERRKAGRAYVYRPRLTAEEARAHALEQVVENFFGGSKEVLLAQLSASSAAAEKAPAPSGALQPRNGTAASVDSGKRRRSTTG